MCIVVERLLLLSRKRAALYCCLDMPMNPALKSWWDIGLLRRKHFNTSSQWKWLGYFRAPAHSWNGLSISTMFLLLESVEIWTGWQFCFIVPPVVFYLHGSWHLVCLLSCLCYSRCSCFYTPSKPDCHSRPLRNLHSLTGNPPRWLTLMERPHVMWFITCKEYKAYRQKEKEKKVHLLFIA